MTVRYYPGTTDLDLSARANAELVKCFPVRKAKSVAGIEWGERNAVQETQSSTVNTHQGDTRGNQRLRNNHVSHGLGCRRCGEDVYRIQHSPTF